MTALRLSGILAVLALGVVLGSQSLPADPPANSERPFEEILRDVIDRTIEVAREEVRRNTGIDPLKRGYIRGQRYEPVGADAAAETRRELRQLNAEHDRKIEQIEAELHRELEEAEASFAREARGEDKSDKIAEKRAKLEEKVDAAYARFEEKIGEENARYDEKRAKILERRG